MSLTPLITVIGELPFSLSADIFYMLQYIIYVEQVHFDFFGSGAGDIPLFVPWDGPVLPSPLLQPTVWPLQSASYSGPSLITTPAWGSRDRGSPGAE